LAAAISLIEGNGGFRRAAALSAGALGPPATLADLSDVPNFFDAVATADDVV
jgi:hypothetical protein